MYLFPRHPDAFAIQLGALSIGALLVPGSSMLRPKDIEFRANDCDAGDDKWSTFESVVDG